MTLSLLLLGTIFPVIIVVGFTLLVVGERRRALQRTKLTAARMINQ